TALKGAGRLTLRTGLKTITYLTGGGALLDLVADPFVSHADAATLGEAAAKRPLDTLAQPDSEFANFLTAVGPREDKMIEQGLADIHRTLTMPIGKEFQVAQGTELGDVLRVLKVPPVQAEAFLNANPEFKANLSMQLGRTARGNL